MTVHPRPVRPWRPWGCGALTCVASGTLLAMAAATGGVVQDGFDGPEFGGKLWEPEAHGKLVVSNGGAHLLGTSGVTRLQLAAPLPNTVYGLRFDFRPDPDHQDGYAFTVQHGTQGDPPVYWYLEFMAGAQRMSGYRHVGGQWAQCGVADLTAKGEVKPVETWYAVEVRNRPERVKVKVIVRESGQEVWTFDVAHDDGPPAPLSFNFSAALAGFIDNFRLAGQAVPGEPLPTPGDGTPLLVLKGDRIRAMVAGDGRVFLFRPAAVGPFGCAFPSAQVLGEAGSVPLSHARTQPNGQRGFVQQWSSEAAGIRLKLAYSLPAQSPWVACRLSLTNTDTKAKQVRVGLHLTPTQAVGEATRSIAFRRGWITSSEPIDTEFDLLQPTQSIPWGTLRFCLSQEEVGGSTVFDVTTGSLIPGGKSKFDLYIPLVSVYNQRDGVVLFANPRAAFLFDIGARGTAARHVFFLEGEDGFADDGFFNGDADVEYTLHLGYPEETDWGHLWRRYYCTANPWLRRGPRAPTGAYTGGAPDAAKPESVDRFVKLGTKYLNTGDIFRPEEKLQALAPNIALAQSKGISCLLWTNIRMAPAPPTFGWDPEMDYREFEDSWIRGPDGKARKCWDGYDCNPSPRFSLAEAEFERLTTWIEKYKMDGIFLDLYGDTTDVDPTRTYAHFPFYPLQVAETEWVKLLADWCDQKGKVLCLNCPHPSLMVTHLGGLLTGDTWGPFKHVSMVERMAAASAGKPHLLLGPFQKPEDHGSGEWLRCSLRAMFYGELVCQWVGPVPNSGEEVRRDLETVDWLFIRNLEIGLLLADSELLGGYTFSALWFKHPSGQGFITLNNETNFIQRPSVVFNRYLELSKKVGKARCRVILWDLTGNPMVLAEGKGAVLAGQTFRAALAPGQVKVLALVKEDTARRLLAAAGRPGV